MHISHIWFICYILTNFAYVYKLLNNLTKLKALAGFTGISFSALQYHTVWLHTTVNEHLMTYMPGKTVAGWERWGICIRSIRPLGRDSSWEDLPRKSVPLGDMSLSTRRGPARESETSGANISYNMFMLALMASVLE